MTDRDRKVLQYLNEARATERALARDMQSQILITPKGDYRSALESHLKQTRDHARRLEHRIGELGGGREPVQAVIGLAESAVGQILALGKAPLSLVRGASREEKVFKNAKDACAAEALEVATYTGLDRLARSVGDDATAKLAVSIRGQEERMLERLLRELPSLADAVVRSEIDGERSYEVGDTGAADALRSARATAKRSAGELESRARRTARTARKVPGVARAEGELKGVVAAPGDLAISYYEQRTAEEIAEKLPELSQVELAKVRSFERKNQNRTTVLSRVATLQAQEPWPGYDELNAGEIRSALAVADEQLAKTVHSYERSHKNRASVLDVAARERERAHA
jgi:ferritin-like metal-binding protein YciE